MTVAAQPGLLTTEQLDAMPEDGKDRWLIRGELREKEWAPHTHGHSRVLATLCDPVWRWAKVRTGPHGEVLAGPVGIRLRRDPDTTVGVDIAYISAETVAANPDEDRIVDGVPVLIVEILSPSDTQGEIDEKVASYLECGVKLVWVVSPTFRTITAYRGDAEPQLFNVTQTLSGEPHLPGFQVPVRDIFSR